MKVLFKEVIGGVTYSRMSDGSYEPPLPADEVAKRAATLPLFEKELRSGQVAGIQTDATFSSGLKHFAEIYGEPYAEETRKNLRKNGVSVTSRTDYEPSLAEFNGDPRAVLEGRQTVKKRREFLKAAANPLEDPFGKPKLSDRAVAECAQSFALQHPEEARKMDAGEMKAEMIKRHAMKGSSK